MARHNLGTVVSFEVTRTLTKRRFWIATLIVPVVMGVVIGLMVMSNMTTSSQVDLQKSAKFDFVYSDASGYVDLAVAAAAGGSKTADRAQAVADVRSGKLVAFFDYPADPVKQPTKVYGADKGMFENSTYTSVASEILVVSAKHKIGDATLATLAQGNLPVTSVTYKAGKESGGLAEVVPPLMFLVIFYVLIVLLGNQMLTSLLEEKENRVTEIILTTLDPTTLVVGKVVSLFIVGIVQILVFALPVIIGYLFFRSALTLPTFDLSTVVLNPVPMIVGALLLLGGFGLFTSTLVAVGAVMPTTKDAGQIFGIMMALIFVPFYAISLVVSDPHSFIVQLFTYFPYSAPVTAMLRNGFGSLDLLESAIVIIELFALATVVLRMAVRLFRRGSIEYSKKVSLRGIFSRRG